MVSGPDQGFAIEFGRFIREAREARGLFQEDVAQALGVTRAYISAFELGKRNIDLGMALRLCDALDVDLNDFIQGQKA